MRSEKEEISLAGFQPALAAQSSQKGEPVSGEKCQRMISRTWASKADAGFSMLDSRCWVAESAGMGEVFSIQYSVFSVQRKIVNAEIAERRRENRTPITRLEKSQAKRWRQKNHFR